MRPADLILAPVFLACALASACNKKADPGPACPQVVDHMLEITKQQYGGHGSLELANRKQMVEECVRRDYPKDVRICLLAAHKLEDLAACQKAEPPAPPPAQDVPASGSNSVGNPR